MQVPVALPAEQGRPCVDALFLPLSVSVARKGFAKRVRVLDAFVGSLGSRMDVAPAVVCTRVHE